MKKLPKLFTPRIAYKPFEYPEYYELGWLPQSSAHWMHTKIPMGDDVKQWNESLTEYEKNMLGRILLGFAQTECEVEDYWTGKIAKWFPKYEIKHAATSFGYFETIHAAAYFYLNETLGLDKEFEAFMEDPTTAAKLERLIEVNVESDNGELDYKKMALSIAVFSAFAEGVTLFSSFGILMSFAPRSLMEGIVQQITWSVRDESLHSNIGCMLFRQMMKEIPEINTMELRTEIEEAARISYKLEEDFILNIFGEGQLPNLTKEQLLNFMKYRVNDRLEALGYEGIYEIEQQMLDQMKWFDVATSQSQKKDFFAVRPTEYSYSDQDWSIDTIDD